jgi:hypothetical protein
MSTPQKKTLMALMALSLVFLTTYSLAFKGDELPLKEQ